MTDSVAKLIPSIIPVRVPLWWWMLAFLSGFVLAAASLNYAPTGRINVLWLWWLWAGLPLIGSFVSLWFLCYGRSRPWLFKWRAQTMHWHPSPAERLQMLGALQQFWLWAGGGVLVGYLALLMFTDLAFGWSSTLIDQPVRVVEVTAVIAAPWGWLWSAAVPDYTLVEATRYARVNPLAGDVTRVGDWWPFLLMSLLVYNLLPRILLRWLIHWKLRRQGGPQVQVRAPEVNVDATAASDLAEDAALNWASAPALTWELLDGDRTPEARLNLGIADWQHDERRVRELLRSPPTRLRWQVSANRSPVAELGDLIKLVRDAGVEQQALELVVNATTDPIRHVASWRTFANQHQLVWLQESGL